MPALLALLIFMISAHSQEEFGSARGPNGELIFKAKSCEVLKAQGAAICEWKLNADKIEVKELLTCTSLPQGKFQVKISKCLPKFAKDEHSKKLAKEGPNCWGTAMGLHDLFPKPRFMWPEELQYWMETPLCRKLAVDEPKKAGDVINVYGPEYLFEGDLTAKDAGTNFWEVEYPGRRNTSIKETIGYTGYQRLLHSETYISDRLSFGKDSPSKDDRWQFHSIEAMYGRPREGEKQCQENQNLVARIREYKVEPMGPQDKKCKYFTQAHRCENFKDYFNREANAEEEKLILKNIEALQDIQTKLFGLVTNSTFTLTKPQIKLYVGLAELTQKKAEAELIKPGLSKTHQMLLVHEYFTAAGIKKSLEQAKLIPE